MEFFVCNHSIQSIRLEVRRETFAIHRTRHTGGGSRTLPRSNRVALDVTRSSVGLITGALLRKSLGHKRSTWQKKGLQKQKSCEWQILRLQCFTFFWLRSVKYQRDCIFRARGGLEWWMGVVAVLLVLLLASLIYLGVKAYQRRTTDLQKV